MNTTKLRFYSRAWTFAALCAVISVGHATDRRTKFLVPNAQLKALGIQTVTLERQADPVRATFPAQVVVPPHAEQVVSSPVTGLVSQLLVRQNQMVRKGEPLVRIISAELGQLQLQLLQAGARATLARQSAQREQTLFDEGIIPQRRVQQAQADLKEGEAALNQAKAALRLSGMPTAMIDQVAASGTPQDSLTLVAAQGGIVTELVVKAGERIDSASLLLRVSQIDTLWLDIQVPVTASAGWRPGTKLKVQDRDISARVLSTNATVTQGSQTVTLRAAIEGKTGRVRPGEFVTVELPIVAMADGWDLPLSAVAHDGNQPYLFVRTPDGFEARPVKLAASAGQRVRVQGPIKAGDQVAVNGVVALKGAWLDAKESK